MASGKPSPPNAQAKPTGVARVGLDAYCARAAALCSEDLAEERQDVRTLELVWLEELADLHADIGPEVQVHAGAVVPRQEAGDRRAPRLHPRPATGKHRAPENTRDTEYAGLTLCVR